MAIFGILASMIFPGFKRFRALAEQIQCQNNMKSFAAAMSVYVEDNDGLYPYGINTYNLKSGYEVPSASLSPQELVFDYLSSHNDIYTCPTDPTPANYQWWKYTSHPNNLKSASYMFCENGLYGNILPYRANKPLKQVDIINPSAYPYMTDGGYCPNGWRWSTLDPASYDPSQPWLLRIDWDHDENVNILYGDMHVAIKWRLDDISNMRNRPDIK